MSLFPQKLKSRGFAPSNKQLLVTSGANIQLYLIAACILNTNDEIIIQDPSFVSYSSIIKSCRGIPRHVPLYEKDNFKIDPALVEKLINKRTKAVIINSPHNPSSPISSQVPQQIQQRVHQRATPATS